MSTESFLLWATFALSLMALYLRQQIADLRRERDSDAQYFEHWLRSLEERKADRIDEVVREDDDYS